MVWTSKTKICVFNRCESDGAATSLIFNQELIFLLLTFNQGKSQFYSSSKVNEAAARTLSQRPNTRIFISKFPPKSFTDPWRDSSLSSNVLFSGELKSREPWLPFFPHFQFWLSTLFTLMVFCGWIQFSLSGEMTLNIHMYALLHINFN